MEIAMHKYILFLIVIIALLCSSCDRSYATQTDEKNQSTLDSTAPHEDKIDEIVIKLDGSKKASLSTHISSINDTMFCDGHKILTEIQYKIDSDGDNEFVTHHLDISIDGEEVDSKNFDEGLQEFKHFGFDFTCHTDEIHLYLIGYNDNVENSGSVIFDLNIDKQQGKKIIVKGTY